MIEPGLAKKAKFSARPSPVLEEGWQYGLLLMDVEELQDRLDADPLDLDSHVQLQEALRNANRIRQRWWNVLMRQEEVEVIVKEQSPAGVAELIVSFLKEISVEEFVKSFPAVPLVRSCA